MSTLRELADVVRSKNAGPYELTFDIMFHDEATWARVRDSGVLTDAEFEAQKAKLLAG